MLKFTFNIQSYSITKNDLSTRGHSAVVRPGIRGADILGEAVDTFLCGGNLWTPLTFITVSISINQVGVRVIRSSAEPKHTVISRTCTVLWVRED